MVLLQRRRQNLGFAETSVDTDLCGTRRSTTQRHVDFDVVDDAVVDYAAAGYATLEAKQQKA
jgi:hypothetical protein